MHKYWTHHKIAIIHSCGWVKYNQVNLMETITCVHISNWFKFVYTVQQTFLIGTNFFETQLLLAGSKTIGIL